MDEVVEVDEVGVGTSVTNWLSGNPLGSKKAFRAGPYTDVDEAWKSAEETAKRFQQEGKKVHSVGADRMEVDGDVRWWATVRWSEA